MYVTFHMKTYQHEKQLTRWVATEIVLVWYSALNRTCSKTWIWGSGHGYFTVKFRHFKSFLYFCHHQLYFVDLYSFALLCLLCFVYW